MYSLKEPKEIDIALPIRPAMQPLQPIAAQPAQVARRRRQLYPFFFHMGPVALSVTSVVLIGLMALLYLSQVGQAVSANQRLQTIHSQEAQLQRQDQDLAATISGEQSPAYIAAHAKQQGLVPADPTKIQTIVARNMKPIPGVPQKIQP